MTTYRVSYSWQGVCMNLSKNNFVFLCPLHLVYRPPHRLRKMRQRLCECRKWSLRSYGPATNLACLLEPMKEVLERPTAWSSAMTGVLIWFFHTAFRVLRMSGIASPHSSQPRRTQVPHPFSRIISPELLDSAGGGDQHLGLVSSWNTYKQPKGSGTQSNWKCSGTLHLEFLLIPSAPPLGHISRVEMIKRNKHCLCHLHWADACRSFTHFFSKC